MKAQPSATEFAPLYPTLELTVRGMDCASCARNVEAALSALPGVQHVQVFLSTEKAKVAIDPERVTVETLAKAVEEAGYKVEIPFDKVLAKEDITAKNHSVSVTALWRSLWALLGVVFGLVLFVVVIGEWLGWIDRVSARIPFALGLLLVVWLGYPVFRNVLKALLRRRITSHTLMTVGAAAALFAGEWATAAIIAFFMRLGAFIERRTTDKGREALKLLLEQAPRRARVERDGSLVEVEAEAVRPGEIVVVKPGEPVPVDGEVCFGRASVNQAAITGESVPVDVEAGSPVLAGSVVVEGTLKVRARAVGRETSYGKIVRLVEEAESSRGQLGRLADRISAYSLPVVASVALLTYWIRHDVSATVAVLVVMCTCAFALGTPVAVLAGIGAAARRGVVIKGGEAVEALGAVDVLFLDKTGTLTSGRPEITDVVLIEGGGRTSERKRASDAGRPDDAAEAGGTAPASEAKAIEDILSLAASAERYSEHPLAQAVVEAARRRGLSPAEPETFEALPGRGVRARVQGRLVAVGSPKWIMEEVAAHSVDLPPELEHLLGAGKTPLAVAVDGRLRAVLAAQDRLRPEVLEALSELQAFGIEEIVMLTGDHVAAARALADRLWAAGLKIEVRAGLLPADKQRTVKAYQDRGRRVAFVGDGVNDAPALAQADVGIAMGEAGTAIAAESAHVVLLRDDFRLIAEAFRLARRTVRVIKGNLGFTVGYSVFGLALAAVGILPPVLAAAAQSIPDVLILANSARLLRMRP
ncbi:MAG: cation-translocating P-type ATPase [Hydrogenibacillus schlegelii]|uniref:Cd(2+)-exporting ATPase n=1 Tax=Hydrogenibacillus schlegelii TaxID=1484 RepID=A0A947D640_HYDSH|nr:cation-translocating P-type ATPase [Hydrogenibacillus schlegelii]